MYPVRGKEKTDRGGRLRFTFTGTGYFSPP
jgi:hypothetical protein